MGCTRGELRPKPAVIGVAGDFPVNLKGWAAAIGLIRIFAKLFSICRVNGSFDSRFKLGLIDLKGALTADQCALYTVDCHRFLEIKN
ncbi:hypothetical protein [Paraburkholderia guartelaensis]|uniref:hypothetical protein n=1 Tax=Paraburkholderia guartelaensis TaxID=2546446 RepID=UPI002AB6E2BD|nr:hypothetical protein [Paraburkholderia guartelaensis]